MLRVLRLGLTGYGLPTFGSLRPRSFGLALFRLTSFRLVDFRLADLWLANGGVRQRSPLRRSPVRPDGFPQDVHENQFNDDDGNPE